MALIGEDDILETCLITLNGVFIGLIRYLLVDKRGGWRKALLSIFNTCVLVICVFAGLGIVFTDEELKYSDRMLLSGSAGFIGLKRLIDILERLLSIREYKR